MIERAAEPNALGTQTANRMNDRARFLRFLATSGIAAAVNILSRWLLDFIVPYEAAITLAYLIGMTVAFGLARSYVFETEAGYAKAEYARFALVNLIAFIQVWIVSVGLAHFIFPALGFFWHSETIAHIVGVASPAVTSFVGHKNFSFGSKGIKR